MQSVDVAIVGGGMVGRKLTKRLAKDGRLVWVHDQSSLMPEFGPVRLRFLGINQRHHSLAILPSPASLAFSASRPSCSTRDMTGRPPVPSGRSPA